MSNHYFDIIGDKWYLFDVIYEFIVFFVLRVNASKSCKQHNIFWERIKFIFRKLIPLIVLQSIGMMSDIYSDNRSLENYVFNGRSKFSSKNLKWNLKSGLPVWFKFDNVNKVALITKKKLFYLIHWFHNEYLHFFFVVCTEYSNILYNTRTCHVQTKFNSKLGYFQQALTG